jgi:hypothetical protein
MKYEAIDHVDGNKQNNHPSNLEGCTTTENINRYADLRKRRTKKQLDDYYKKKVITIDMNTTTTKRKVRSDKKRDVKPVVPVHLKNEIYDYSQKNDIPMKNILEILCKNSMSDESFLRKISPYFKRNLETENFIYEGSMDNETIPRKIKGESVQVSLRLSSEVFENLSQLSHTLSIPPTTVASLLIQMYMEEKEIADILNCK